MYKEHFISFLETFLIEFHYLIVLWYFSENSIFVFVIHLNPDRSFYPTFLFPQVFSTGITNSLSSLLLNLVRLEDVLDRLPQDLVQREQHCSLATSKLLKQSQGSIAMTIIDETGVSEPRNDQDYSDHAGGDFHMGEGRGGVGEEGDGEEEEFGLIMRFEEVMKEAEGQ